MALFKKELTKEEMKKLKEERKLDNEALDIR